VGVEPLGRDRRRDPAREGREALQVESHIQLTHQVEKGDFALGHGVSRLHRFGIG